MASHLLGFFPWTPWGLTFWLLDHLSSGVCRFSWSHFCVRGLPDPGAQGLSNLVGHFVSLSVEHLARSPVAHICSANNGVCPVCHGKIGTLHL
ncbi:hypothetical protein PF010_g10963 [Phytophthora fragariae]|uniref:Secreted protein n=1 Tax=Phytophthora fragariae TaxID=53985 RepID=A0A6A4DPS2_9STRA|nr:hypothetical protein PF009_g11847 [Phytophthora fragariae]KAE9111007.1 hypothetical protein PF010_g10963 [Phytophthora fragariae]KAE9119426.1 hypothetical protein PF007_g8556 [Phytophthora fragariae]KAE9142007.1 hypothetical protein PF006_g12850 [Phytophthora fragariae]KAE9230068.1 hypothetical protein PF004_g10584 [Phytophthora fragariae]